MRMTHYEQLDLEEDPEEDPEEDSKEDPTKILTKIRKTVLKAVMNRKVDMFFFIVTVLSFICYELMMKVGLRHVILWHSLCYYIMLYELPFYVT